MPACSAHPPQVALEPDGRGEHDDHPEETRNDRLAVESDEHHHPQHEGDRGPLAIAASVPIDGLGSNPLRELGILSNQRLFQLRQNALFVIGKRHYLLPPGSGPSVCAPCWHDQPARTTRTCPFGLPRLVHLTTRQLRTRPGVRHAEAKCRDGALARRASGRWQRAGPGDSAWRPPQDRDDADPMQGGGPAARRRRSAGGTRSNRLSAFFRPLRLAPHDERRDQRTEQAGDQDHQDQRRIAVIHPEIDADPMEVARTRTTPAAHRPPRPRSVGPVGAGRGARRGRHRRIVAMDIFVPLGPVCRAGGRSARIVSVGRSRGSATADLAAGTHLGHRPDRRGRAAPVQQATPSIWEWPAVSRTWAAPSRAARPARPARPRRPRPAMPRPAQGLTRPPTTSSPAMGPRRTCYEKRSKAEAAGTRHGPRRQQRKGAA